MKQITPKHLKLITNICDLRRSGFRVAQIAEKTGKTRQTVYNALKNGERLGIIDHASYCREKPTASAIYRELARQPSLVEVAQALRMSPGRLQYYIRSQSIDTDVSAPVRRALRIDRQKHRLRQWYLELHSELHDHPSTTEMQSADGGRAKYASIIRIWGSIEAFRTELRVRRKFKVNPVWLHRTNKERSTLHASRRNDAKRRMLALLQVDRETTMAEILSVSGFKDLTARALLKELVDDGIVVVFAGRPKTVRVKMHVAASDTSTVFEPPLGVTGVR